MLMLWSNASAPYLWFVTLSFVSESQEHSCRSCMCCFLVPRERAAVAGTATKD